MSEYLGNKRELIKELIKKIHKGENVSELKEKLKDELANMTPFEITEIEQELIKEGMPPSEIHELCESHIELFQESIRQSDHIAPYGHPIYILMEEHNALLNYAARLLDVVKELRKKQGFEDSTEELEFFNHLVEHFKDSEKHYLREENVLFSYIEKHGLTGPTQVMWSEHDDIRAIKKDLYELPELIGKIEFETFIEKLFTTGRDLSELLASHFYKENNILFPAAMQLLSDDEWKIVEKEFYEIGFCCFSPVKEEEHPEEETPEEGITEDGIIKFPTGSLSFKDLFYIFKTLPVDITFVDKDDRVKFFSETKERIFVRTPAIIGRTVQNCHPQKSVHIVNKILEAFKNGTKDVASFWINFQGKYVLISYYAVRDKNGEYLGTLEVTQDVTDIKKLEGEKRLLDWED